MIEEINFICIGGLRYRFSFEIIQHYDFDYNDKVMRIDFQDGSFIEFQKRNVVCVEVNTSEGVSE